MTTTESQRGSNTLKLIATIVIIAIVLVILLFLFLGQRANFILRTIDYVVLNIVQVSGWNHHLVRGVVILLTIPFFWAVAKYTKIVIVHMRLRPSLRLYTNPYGVVIVLYVALFFVAMYFASRDAYALKYCAETPEGIKVYSSPIKDPVYGIECKPCTFEQIMLLRREKGMLSSPRRIEIGDPENYEFFDALTGKPKVWYSRLPEGNFEFYDRDGKHPRTGRDLVAVDSDVVADVITHYQHDKQVAVDRGDSLTRIQEIAQHERFLSQYLDISAPKSGDKRTVVVYVSTGPGGRDSEAESAIARELSSKGMRVNLGLFKPAFTDGAPMSSLERGDFSVLKQFEVAKYADFVLLGKSSVTYTTNADLTGLKTAVLTLDLRWISVTNRTIENSASIPVRGAGFDEASALQRALEDARPRLTAFLSSL